MTAPERPRFPRWPAGVDSVVALDHPTPEQDAAVRAYVADLDRWEAHRREVQRAAESAALEANRADLRTALAEIRAEQARRLDHPTRAEAILHLAAAVQVAEIEAGDFERGLVPALRLLGVTDAELAAIPGVTL